MLSVADKFMQPIHIHTHACQSDLSQREEKPKNCSCSQGEIKVNTKEIGVVKFANCYIVSCNLC